MKISVPASRARNPASSASRDDVCTMYSCALFSRANSAARCTASASMNGGRVAFHARRPPRPSGSASITRLRRTQAASIFSGCGQTIPPCAGVRAAYFIVDVTRDRLDRISAMIERGTLDLPVGEVLELADASTAHGMLDGAPHKPGKIVLKVAD